MVSKLIPTANFSFNILMNKPINRKVIINLIDDDEVVFVVNIEVILEDI